MIAASFDCIFALLSEQSGRIAAIKMDRRLFAHAANNAPVNDAASTPPLSEQQLHHSHEVDFEAPESRDEGGDGEDGGRRSPIPGEVMSSKTDATGTPVVSKRTQEKLTVLNNRGFVSGMFLRRPFLSCTNWHRRNEFDVFSHSCNTHNDVLFTEKNPAHRTVAALFDLRAELPVSTPWNKTAFSSVRHSVFNGLQEETRKHLLVDHEVRGDITRCSYLP